MLLLRELGSIGDSSSYFSIRARVKYQKRGEALGTNGVMAVEAYVWLNDIPIMND